MAECVHPYPSIECVLERLQLGEHCELVQGAQVWVGGRRQKLQETWKG